MAAKYIWRDVAIIPPGLDYPRILYQKANYIETKSF